MTDTQTEDPAVIEREIRETQNNMSSTIDKLGNQLTMKNMFNAMLDKADSSNVDGRMILDQARRNPVALGMVAIGAIWLISEKDAKIPSFGSKSGKGLFERFKGGSNTTPDYASHMSGVEQHPDEDSETYQRRRDVARSNYFMVERSHDEDDKSFRQRLDGIAEAYRDKRSALADKSSQVKNAAKQKVSDVSGKTKDAFDGNPLIGGILAAAAGAAAGAALPVTQTERGKLGSIGGKMRDSISSQTDQATSKFREKKDDLLSKASDSLGQTGNSQAPEMVTDSSSQAMGTI